MLSTLRTLNAFKTTATTSYPSVGSFLYNPIVKFTFALEVWVELAP